MCEILGSTHVYFQPPPTVKMEYPCIVYSRGSGGSVYADNRTYTFTQSYEVTLIDPDPDSGLVEKLATSLPMIRMNRHYTADNLNHDNFTLYY